MSPPEAAASRSQAERTAETRGRLIDACASCLAELGYARTTILRVCARADVSTGALQHHFGTREQLMADTLVAVYARLRAQVVAGLEVLDDERDRVEPLVDLMWDVFCEPDFKSVLELWLASSNESALGERVAGVARDFDDAIQPIAARLFPTFATENPEFPVYVSLLFQTLQGMGLARAALGTREGDEMRERVLALLKRLLRDAQREETTG